MFNHMVKYREEHLDLVFGALSDPTRRKIIERLERGPTRVTEMASHFRISLPAISKHLRVLEHAGLLKRERLGRVHRISLAAGRMEAACVWLERYRLFWSSSLDSLSDFLDQNPTKTGEQQDE